MSILAMHTATTGLGALNTEIDVIANNLANVNTYGFKGSRANFEDLLYQHLEPAGGLNSQGVAKPVGTAVGLGVKISNTQRLFTQGSPVETGVDTDMYIQGDGFFRVQTLEDIGGGYAYTRAGNFFVNLDGELVLGNTDGHRLDPPVQVPDGYTNVTIGLDGVVRAVGPGETTTEDVGQIQLFRFPNPAGLAAQGMNLFTETDASGEAVGANPGTEGLGTLLGGFLETSNVDAVTQLVNLIRAQRAFELNSQVITTGNEMLQTVTHLK